MNSNITRELTPGDFHVVDTPKGKLIQSHLKDIMLVLFYKEDCETSSKIKSILQLISATDIECTFGYFNADIYPDYIKNSLKTKTPVNEIPYLVIFANGRPYMSYSGNFNAIDITKLITYVQLLQTITASIKFCENSIVPVYHIKNTE